MILKRIFDEYGFNIEALLIKEYKRLKLSLQELAVLLVLFSSSNKKRVFSLSSIAKKIEYNQNEIAGIIESLIQKKFIGIKLEINNKKEREVYELEGTFIKITELLQHDELENQKQVQISNISETIEALEIKLNRQLRNDELDRVRLWYETYKFEHTRILNSIESLNKVVNVLYIEKVLNMELDKTPNLDEKTNTLLDDIYKRL